MPSRGKKRSSATSPPPTSPRQQHQNNAIPPPEKDYQDITAHRPRRSSRRKGMTSNANVKGAAAAPTLADLENMKENDVPAPKAAKKLDRKVKDNKIDVENAIESLEEMELAFRRDTKRRKLQVESSIISSHDDSGERHFRPRMVRGDSAVLQPGRLLLTPEQDGHNAEQDDRVGSPGDNVDAAEDALEPADRGAKRPPAVNSDYLPLPWRGRLGYVSDTQSPSALTQARGTDRSIGMPQYILAGCKTTCLQFPNVSHCLDH